MPILKLLTKLRPQLTPLRTAKERHYFDLTGIKHILSRTFFEALCACIFHEVRWKEAVFKTEERSRDTGEKDL